MTSSPVSSVQLRESATLLDFSWVNIPRWGQRSCVHTGHSARSARGPHSRCKDGWSNQARVHVGTAVRIWQETTPSAQTINSDEQMPSRVRLWMWHFHFPRILTRLQRCMRAAALCDPQTACEENRLNGAWKRQRLISLRGALKWGVVTGHPQDT